MASFNRVIIVGNLTRDPEHRQLASGQSVCRLGLASNRQFKNKQTGDMIQEVCYVDIDVWGAQAESCRQYLSKGRSILVEGRLKFDTWEDQNGQNRNKLSIVADRVVFLSAAQGSEEGVAQARPVQQSQAAVPKPAPKPKKKVAPPAPEPQTPENQALEKELFDQIEQIKKRTQEQTTGQTATQTTTSTGEMSFKDEPPFQDDLPF